MPEKSPFSGAVKEYTEERYILDKKEKEILDYKYIWKYGENNKLSEVNRYNSKNKLADASYFQYDNFGNVIEMTVKTAKGSKKQTIKYEYIDNKLFQIANMARSFKTISKFDDSGNLIEELFFRDASTPPYITRYTNIYDINKRLIEKQTILPSGELDSTIRYKFNSKGLIIEENKINNKTSWFANGREFKLSKNSVSRHTYNDSGDLVLSEFHSDSGVRWI
jgi:hypothetical protein